MQISGYNLLMLLYPFRLNELGGNKRLKMLIYEIKILFKTKWKRFYLMCHIFNRILEGGYCCLRHFGVCSGIGQVKHYSFRVLSTFVLSFILNGANLWDITHYEVPEDYFI